MMEDGIITLGSERADALGFTPDLFEGYLWKTDDRITISLIFSKEPGRGHFSRLLDTLWQRGYSVGVPTPFARMRAILEHKGFKRTREWFKSAQEDVEVWVRDPEYGDMRTAAAKRTDNDHACDAATREPV